MKKKNYLKQTHKSQLYMQNFSVFPFLIIETEIESKTIQVKGKNKIK